MNIFKVARNAVSKDKYRFQDGWFDLDLTYITNRIIAMGIPGEKMDKIWRNDGDDVATFLWFYHPKHFMIFNLSGEEYEYLKFDNRVMDFGFPDHSACPLGLLFQIVEAIKKWLDEDEENVAVVHCLAGRGRTGMVISTYLLREGFFRDAKAALKFFAEARSATAAGVLTPSQIRYAHYANEIYRGRIDPPFGRERPLVLRKIVISPFPVIPDAEDPRKMGGWDPVIKVYTLAGHHKEPNNERQLYSSDYHPTKLYYSKPGNIRVMREVDNNGTIGQEQERVHSKPKQREKIIVDITKGCLLRGDIQLKFYHQASSRLSFARILKSGYLKTVEVLSTALSKKYPYICLFRLSFHTSFIGRQLNEIITKTDNDIEMAQSMGESYGGGAGSIIWTLRKPELDAMFSGPAHTKMLPEDFSIKLVFSDPSLDDSAKAPAASASASTSSLRGSAGSRSTPDLPPIESLQSLNDTTSAMASLALSPRSKDKSNHAHSEPALRDVNSRNRATIANLDRYNAQDEPSRSTNAARPRENRNTVAFTSRRPSADLRTQRDTSKRSIDFEDIFIKQMPPDHPEAQRDSRRTSESTEPMFPPASAFRRRSSLPDSSHNVEAAAAATAKAKSRLDQRKSVTPSPSRGRGVDPPRSAPTSAGPSSAEVRGAADRGNSAQQRAFHPDIISGPNERDPGLHPVLRPTPPSSSNGDAFTPATSGPFSHHTSPLGGPQAPLSAPAQLGQGAHPPLHPMPFPPATMGPGMPGPMWMPPQQPPGSGPGSGPSLHAPLMPTPAPLSAPSPPSGHQLNPAFLPPMHQPLQPVSAGPQFTGGGHAPLQPTQLHPHAPPMSYHPPNYVPHSYPPQPVPSPSFYQLPPICFPQAASGGADEQRERIRRQIMEQRQRALQLDHQPPGPLPPLLLQQQPQMLGPRREERRDQRCGNDTGQARRGEESPSGRRSLEQQREREHGERDRGMRGQEGARGRGGYPPESSRGATRGRGQGRGDLTLSQRETSPDQMERSRHDDRRSAENNGNKRATVLLPPRGGGNAGRGGRGAGSQSSGTSPRRTFHISEM